MKIKKKNVVDYVNNRELYEAMVQFKKDYVNAKKKGQRPQISEYLGDCFLRIARRVSDQKKFRRYTYKEEMISDGYENCVMYMHNFDPEKYNNPFAYFTQIIHHAFIRRIQKERKQQYIKLKITQDQFITDDIDGSENQAQLYTNNHEYIRDYEYSLSYKKKKAKKIGLEQFLD